MKLTIIRNSGSVSYNNIIMPDIDMSGIPLDLNAVQYDDVLGISEEEWLGDEHNTQIPDINAYQFIIDRWQIAYDKHIEDNTFTDEELLIFAKDDKRSEIKISYHVEEENSIIVINSISYSSNRDHLTEIDLERRLALDNDETSILIFDINDLPHSVNISNILPVMQQIRTINRAKLTKLKDLYKQINTASTVEEINAIVW